MKRSEKNLKDHPEVWHEMAKPIFDAPIQASNILKLGKQPAKKQQDFRKEFTNLQKAIDHLSLDELSEIMNVVKMVTKDFDIMTRDVLRRFLENTHSSEVITASLILENEGAEEAILYLLRIVHYRRFGKAPNFKIIRVRSSEFRNPFWK